tara:strand:- start:1817 stop:2407 length:591 start_codon:yes stop_codon:yes gene_type:complete
MATPQEELALIETSFKRPIPGSSLASDPDSPAPYEKAPEFTSLHKASEYMFTVLIQPKLYVALMESIDEGIPIMDITQFIVFNEFQKGKFNPDLMLLMMEPVAYMLLSLAERLDLNIVIDQDEDEEEALSEEANNQTLKMLQKKLSNSPVSSSTLPKNIQQEIQELPQTLKETKSLLEVPESVEQQPDSLMARGDQ